MQMGLSYETHRCSRKQFVSGSRADSLMKSKWASLLELVHQASSWEVPLNYSVKLFDPVCWALLHFVSLSVREASVDAGLLSKAVKRHIPGHRIHPAWAVFEWPNLLPQTEGKEDMGREASGNTNFRDSKVTVMVGMCFPAVTRLPWVHQDSGSCLPPPSHQKLQAAFGFLGGSEAQMTFGGFAITLLIFSVPCIKLLQS